MYMKIDVKKNLYLAYCKYVQDISKHTYVKMERVL